MSRLIATLFGVGYLRPASGTWASAVAVLLGVVILRFAGPITRQELDRKILPAIEKARQ